MTLDLVPLKKALQTLKSALDEHKNNMANELMRDGCIQRFEYCYELSIKMLRRYLEITSDGRAEIDAVTLPDLIRIAAERGLVRNSWDVWEKFRKARNKTSHIYDAAIAAEVYTVIPAFLEEAEILLSYMSKGNT